MFTRGGGQIMKHSCKTPDPWGIRVDEISKHILVTGRMALRPGGFVVRFFLGLAALCARARCRHKAGRLG